MARSRKYCIGSLTYVTLRITFPEDAEFHLFVYSNTSNNGYLLFIKTKISHFIAIKTLIKHKL